MKRIDVVALGLVLGVVAAVVGCTCFALTNTLNGTTAEDPKCCFGPCAPGQHAGEGEGE